MTTDAYRSLEPATAARFEALLELQDRERSQATTACVIVVRRVGRIVAGAVAALLGGTAMLVGLAWDSPFSRSLFESGSSRFRGAETLLLLAAWPSAVAAGLVACALARAFTARSLQAPAMPPAALAMTEIVRLEESRPLLTLRRLAARLEGWSAAALLVGLTMTAPLTLHAIVALLFRWPDAIGDFGNWIAASGFFVGPAHLVLAFMAARWARSLRRRETHALRERIHWAWVRAMLVTVGVAAVPCFLLLSVDPPGSVDAGTAALLSLIPAGIAALTGVVFVPAMYLLAARRIARERLALG
jgi:hypothetical protein